MLIFAVRAFQAQAYHLSIIGPLLGSVRQPGNDPLDLFALCRILDTSGDGFKIRKKALFVVVHGHISRKVFNYVKRKGESVQPYCHRNFPPRERWGSRIVDFSRVDWAGAAAILLKSGQRMLLF
jgi:hypothetical protein